VEIFQALVRIQPDLAAYHSGLGLSWNHLGNLFDAARDNPQAVRPFQLAVDEQQLAVAKAAEVSRYQGFLCNHLENLGEQYVDRGRVADGLPHYRRAIEIRRALCTAQPENRAYSLDLAEALVALGNIERHDGDSAAAIRSFTQGRDVLERLATSPGDAAIFPRLGMILTQEALALAEAQKPEAAIPSLERALAILSPLGAPGTADVQVREWLSEALWQLARIERTLNQTSKAGRLDVQRVDLWKGRPAAELANLALKETRRATLIGYGKTAIGEQAKRVRNLDLDLAAADLRLAISQGFLDLPLLQNDPDFPILLAHDDIESLTKDLRSPPKASQPKPKNN
jgi:tetratricopeptide (TPR) repeat protein